MQNYNLTAVVRKEAVGYVSRCSELSVTSAGDSVEEALENLKEAIEIYLENAKELGMPDDLYFSITSDKLTAAISVAS